MKTLVNFITKNEITVFDAYDWIKYVNLITNKSEDPISIDFILIWTFNKNKKINEQRPKDYNEYNSILMETHNGMKEYIKEYDKSQKAEKSTSPDYVGHRYWP